MTRRICVSSDSTGDVGGISEGAGVRATGCGGGVVSVARAGAGCACGGAAGGSAATGGGGVCAGAGGAAGVGTGAGVCAAAGGCGAGVTTGGEIVTGGAAVDAPLPAGGRVSVPDRGGATAPRAVSV